MCHERDLEFIGAIAKINIGTNYRIIINRDAA